MNRSREDPTEQSDEEGYEVSEGWGRGRGRGVAFLVLNLLELVFYVWKKVQLIEAAMN